MKHYTGALFPQRLPPRASRTTEDGGPLVLRGGYRPAQIMKQGNKEAFIYRGPPQRRFHPLVLLVAGIFVAFVLYVIFNVAVNVCDDLRYGNPRTYRTDAVVGHNDSETNKTRFTFQNLDGIIQITEYPGGDPSKIRVYIVSSLFGTNADRVYVEGTFRDMNGDGKRDMIIKFQGQQIIYLNDGEKFNKP